MKTKDLLWLLLLVAAALLTVSLKYVPYLPGDVALTRLIQSLPPESKLWAKILSSTAKMPWILVPIAVTFVLSLYIAGLRAGILSIVCFIGLWLLGKWLGPVIAQPRPAADLVMVAETASGSAFPSIFAFNYVATFGFLAVVSAVKASGNLRSTILLICGLLLIAGLIARVSLAAHWPSDVLISYLIGLLWATLLVRFIR
jgi:membrane-associated phospholipid phosphatase